MQNEAIRAARRPTLRVALADLLAGGGEAAVEVDTEDVLQQHVGCGAGQGARAKDGGPGLGREDLQQLLGVAPGSARRVATPSSTGRSVIRCAMWHSARSEAASAQWASSTASSSGRRSAIPATSQ